MEKSILGDRFWPAKPKTEPRGPGFGLVLKQRIGRVVRTCRVGCTWLLRLLEAKMERSTEEGGGSARKPNIERAGSILV